MREGRKRRGSSRSLMLFRGPRSRLFLLRSRRRRRREAGPLPRAGGRAGRVKGGKEEEEEEGKEEGGSDGRSHEMSFDRSRKLDLGKGGQTRNRRIGKQGGK